jgi:hypothetical protein
MSLRTLHSDLSAPEQVLGEYACPECGSERRLPLATTGSSTSLDPIDTLDTLGAA